MFYLYVRNPICEPIYKCANGKTTKEYTYIMSPVSICADDISPDD